VKEKPNYNADESGRTPFQKFQALAKALVNVPKPEADRRAKGATKPRPKKKS